MGTLGEVSVSVQASPAAGISQNAVKTPKQLNEDRQLSGTFRLGKT